MAQRTVKTYDALVSALEALTPGGGKIILDPDPSIVVPMDGALTLPEGSWDIVGKTAESTLVLQGQLQASEGASAIIHGCNLDLTVPTAANSSCFVGDIQVKDVTFSGDLDSQFVAAGWQIVDTAVVAVPEDDSSLDTAGTENDPVESEPDPEPTADEPESGTEPELEPVMEPEPEPASDPEKATTEPVSEPEPDSDAQTEANSESDETLKSKPVSNIAIHIGPSAKSRSNAFTGAVNVTEATATDALGHVWVKVIYKLPGSGKRAEGFVRQDKIQ